MKKKWLTMLLSGLCVVACVGGFSACKRKQPVKTPYEIWLDVGYTGTEAEFIEWLKGHDGDDRNHAFDAWVEAGYAGTEEDFLNWLLATMGEQEGTAGLQYQRIPGKDEYRVMGIGIAADLDIVIPTTYNKMPVTEIDAGAFKGTEYLESVTVSGGVKVIGDSAFEQCKSLKSVVIPNSVTSIGEKAFGWCEVMTDLTLGSNLATVGADAFRDCVSLEKVNYTGTADSWAKINFEGHEETNPVFYAKSLYINNELLTKAELTTGTTISKHAFYNCMSLLEVSIPASVTSIGEEAFRGCENLLRTDYAGTVDMWAQINFVDNYSNPIYYSKNLYLDGNLLTKATLNVAKVSSNSFVGCDSLTELTISDLATEIEDYAFYCCKNLKKVTLGKGLTKIGWAAFFEGDNLESVTFTDGGEWYTAISVQELEAREGYRMYTDDATNNANDLKSMFAYCYWYK